MRKVLRFWKITNFMTVAALYASYRALFPFQGAEYDFWHDSSLIVAAALHGVISLACCTCLWIVVRKCYLDTHGCKLRDVNPLGGWYAALYVLVTIVACTLGVLANTTAFGGLLYFWFGITVLVLNVGSLLFLAGYVVTVRLGHRLGKIAYVEPCQYLSPVFGYDAFFNCMSLSCSWEIPEE